MQVLFSRPGCRVLPEPNLFLLRARTVPAYLWAAVYGESPSGKSVPEMPQALPRARAVDLDTGHPGSLAMVPTI